MGEKQRSKRGDDSNVHTYVLMYLVSTYHSIQQLVVAKHMQIFLPSFWHQRPLISSCNKYILRRITLCCNVHLQRIWLAFGEIWRQQNFIPRLTWNDLETTNVGAFSVKLVKKRVAKSPKQNIYICRFVPYMLMVVCR